MSEAETYEELALKLAEMQATMDSASNALSGIVICVFVIIVCCAILGFINKMYEH